LSFACAPINPVGKRKNKNYLCSHCLKNPSQKNEYSPPTETQAKNKERQSKKDGKRASSFQLQLSTPTAHTSTRNKFLLLQNGPLRQCEQRPPPPSNKFNRNTSNRRRKSKEEVCHPYTVQCVQLHGEILTEN